MTDKPNHPLKNWRLKQEPKMTLTTLAGEVGVTASHISEIENYKNEPSFELLTKLHDKTGLNVADFMRQSETAQ